MAIFKYKFGGLIFFLATILISTASFAQTRDVTLTPDQLSGLTITFQTVGQFQIPVTATGLGGTMTQTITVVVLLWHHLRLLLH